MRNRTMSWVFLCVVTIFGRVAWGEEDPRVIGKLSHTRAGSPLREVSIYLTFEGNKADGLPGLPSGDETRFYSKVWDDLYLQVTTETGENGTTGYMFAFSKDQPDQNALSPEEDKTVPTLREVAAADFRSEDNFTARPLLIGPGKPRDRGALRIVSFPDFDAEIRVLEFNIGDAKLGKKPYFKTLSCLVTLREKGSKK